jgi:hypothetical protein
VSDIVVIWVGREREYLWKWDWTGGIRLIRLNKFRRARKRRSPDGAQRNPGLASRWFPDCASLHPGYDVRCAVYCPLSSLRGAKRRSNPELSRRRDGLHRCARNDGFPYVTAARFGSTISNMRGNSSISAISSARRIALPVNFILPLATASGNVVCFAITSSTRRWQR